MIRIFFLSQSSPILELFPFDKITLKSYICTVVTVMAKQCWSQTVLESGSWGHSVLQTPALVILCVCVCVCICMFFLFCFFCLFEKIRHVISCDTRCQVLFSKKKKMKNLECHLLRFLPTTSRVDYLQYN